MCSDTLYTLSHTVEVQEKVLQLVVHRIVVADSWEIIKHVVLAGPIQLQPEHQTPGN